MTTEERLTEIRGRVAKEKPFIAGLAYFEDVPLLLELVDDYKDQMKKLSSRLPRQTHWCPEWDGLLILPSDKEFETCICEGLK